MKSISKAELSDLLNEGLPDEQAVRINGRVMIITYGFNEKSDTNVSYEGNIAITQSRLKGKDVTKIQILSESGKFNYSFMRRDDFKAYEDRIIIRKNSPATTLYLQEIVSIEY